MPVTASIKRFAADEGGAMLVMWGVSFVVLFGIVALSFDLGRIGITRSELQAYADNIALAAAGELDGNADALTRAQSAAENLIADRKTFGSGDDALSGAADFTLTFYSDIPASDTDPLTAVTTDPADARYVHADVMDSTVAATFGAAFAALSGNAGPNENASATAVAGFTQYACDVTPMMFCVPGGWSADANVGTMIRLRSGGNGAAWGPGDFGFLDPSNVAVDDEGPCAGLTGVNMDACLLGAEGAITQCFDQRGVDIEPGQKVGIEDAIFNVRFDIYKSIMNGKRNSSVYRPAPNVIKGIVPNGGGSCIGGNEEVSPDTAPLPRDACFNNGSCSRFGNGNWTPGRANYVNMNYGGADPHSTAATRYQYYLAEIAQADLAGATAPILSGLSETGRPMCSNNQSSNPKRRVIIAAAIDCNANPINGAATNVPVEEFVEIFLTEPVGSDGSSPPTLDIWGEVIGTAGGGADGSGDAGIFRDVVQLYR